MQRSHQHLSLLVCVAQLLLVLCFGERMCMPLPCSKPSLQFTTPGVDQHLNDSLPCLILTLSRVLLCLIMQLVLQKL